VSPATAALIGAGVAVAVGLGAQYIAHRLAVSRDRRNQRRERLHGVIAEAALALYQVEWLPDADLPKDIGPRRDLVRAITPMLKAVSRGLALLRVHFGHDHWVVREYEGAFKACLDSQAALTSLPDFQDKAAIEAIARQVIEANAARDAWMASAKAEVERI
jgi:hypothetical protein